MIQFEILAFLISVSFRQITSKISIFKNSNLYNAGFHGQTKAKFELILRENNPVHCFNMVTA